jgi:hypothetical protein
MSYVGDRLLFADMIFQSFVYSFSIFYQLSICLISVHMSFLLIHISGGDNILRSSPLRSDNSSNNHTYK